MMPFLLRLLGVEMADSGIPTNWKTAWPFLIWIVIIFSFGLEGIVTLVHGQFIVAAVSLAGMLAVTAAAIHWDRIKAIATVIDARWLVLMLLVAFGALAFAALIGGQQPPAIAIALLAVATAAIMAAFLIFYRFEPELHARKAAATVSPNQSAPPLDGQAHLDFLHLIDFGIDQTTVVKLERLIDTAKGPEITYGSDDPEEAHKSRNVYISFVRQHLDGDRRDSYLNIIQNAQFEAERTLREMPPDQRPSGDPLNVREHAISQLQFTRAVQFLRHQKREVEDRLISKRFQLIERRDLRNKGKT
jgi:hypothetical protein